MALVFGLQILQSIDFTKIFKSKGLKSKNKGHTNFYDCCDLTKKVYLMYVVHITQNNFNVKNEKSHVST